MLKHLVRVKIYAWQMVLKLIENQLLFLQTISFISTNERLTQMMLIIFLPKIGLTFIVWLKSCQDIKKRAGGPEFEF